MKNLLLTSLSFFSIILAAKAGDDDSAIKKVVYHWNDIHNTGSGSEFRDLFNYTVLFYGEYLSREQCVNKKRELLQNEYDQKIISPIKINYYTSGTIKSSFTKEVKYEGEIKEYPSYLLLEKRGSKYVITGESDLTTDQSLHFQLNPGQEVGASVNKPSADNSRFLIFAVAGIAIIALGYFAFRKKKNTQFPKKTIANKTIVNKTIVNKTTASKTTANKTLANKTAAVAAPAPELPIQGIEEIRDPFEKFVVERFDPNDFEILNSRHEKYNEGRFTKSIQHPDFEIRFRHKHYDTVFAVACKWRKGFYNDKIVWAKPHQWDTYNEFEQSTGKPVFVVIGIGGDPGSPENIFILPLKKIYSTELSMTQLKQYKRLREENFFFDPEKVTLS